MATTVCISVGRCQLQCQKLKMDYSSSGSMVVGSRLLPIHHKGTSSTKYRKMKISVNLGTLDIHMWQLKQEHAARHSIIISQINKDSSQLSELVGALEADKADTFVSVVKSIRNKHKLPSYAIIQGIHISGDTLIHTAARHKAEVTLNLICQACPPLLTAQNWVGDTVWHVLAIDEGLNTLFRQLRVFRQELLSTPTTYKAGKNGQHLRLNSLNNEGNTALHASLISCNESIADELFEMTPAHESWCYFLPNKEGKSAIYLAAEAGYVNLLRRMMNVAASYPGSLSETLKGKSIIHAAIAGKHLVSLDIIMELAPELFHSVDERGMTPLQWAASSGEVFAYLKAKLGRTSPGSNYI
ncbi:unnamed protein product [Rhodiola kirilowii]